MVFNQLHTGLGATPRLASAPFLGAFKSVPCGTLPTGSGRVLAADSPAPAASRVSYAAIADSAQGIAST